MFDFPKSHKLPVFSTSEVKKGISGLKSDLKVRKEDGLRQTSILFRSEMGWFEISSEEYLGDKSGRDLSKSFCLCSSCG